MMHKGSTFCSLLALSYLCATTHARVVVEDAADHAVPEQSSNLRRSRGTRQLMGGGGNGGMGGGKDNNFAFGGGNGIGREQNVANEYGIEETKPCVPWSYITENQMINPSSDDGCRDLSQGYPFNGGCCRSYWWLILDRGNSYPSVPCICNQYTRDPSSFPGVPQPVPPTPPPTFPPPTTPSPTPKPPTTPPPTTPAPQPTTAAPGPADATESTTNDVPPPGTGFSSDHCFDYQNILFWNAQAYPDYATKARCTDSDHCEGAGECCLGSLCMCGTFMDADAECVPAPATDRTDDVGTTATIGGLDETTTTTVTDPNAPPSDTCLTPENNVYWQDPFYAEKTQCTTSSDGTCVGADSCCLAEYCMCGTFFNMTEECVP